MFVVSSPWIKTSLAETHFLLFGLWNKNKRKRPNIHFLPKARRPCILMFKNEVWYISFAGFCLYPMCFLELFPDEIKNVISGPHASKSRTDSLTLTFCCSLKKKELSKFYNDQSKTKKENIQWYKHCFANKINPFRIIFVLCSVQYSGRKIMSNSQCCVWYISFFFFVVVKRFTKQWTRPGFLSMRTLSPFHCSLCFYRFNDKNTTRNI